MVKYLLINLFLSMYFISPVLAQERTTMELLTSYKWCISEEELIKEKDPEDPNDPYPIEDYLIFSATTWTTYEKWSDEPNKLESMTSRYYIGIEGTEVHINKPNSDYFDRYSPVKFDVAKVGQNKNGDYLLIESGLDGEASIHEICEINDKKLVLRLVTPETFGSGIITTYEARPKD